MKKIFIFAFSVVFLLSTLTMYVGAEKSQSEVPLLSKGVINTTIVTIDQIDEETFKEVVIDGVNVMADVKIKSNTIKGNLNTTDGNKYKLRGLIEEDTNDFMRFEGEVINYDNLYFEAYVIKNDPSSIINIFGIEENGERIDPFTIHLNNKQSTIKTKIKTKDELRLEKNVDEENVQATTNESSFSLLSTSNYDILLSGSNYGMIVEVQGWKNRSSDTPWISRVWTRPNNAKNMSVAPSTVTHVNILNARVSQDAPLRSHFEAIRPASNSSTSFAIPFLWKGNIINVPVRTSSTSVTGGWSTMYRAEYSWRLKSAYTYEHGKNSEGILTQTEFKWNRDVPRNSGGYIVVPQRFNLSYEMVGNFREYYNPSFSFNIWYK